MCAQVFLQDIKSLHEKLQTEVQETFADFLGSVSKDPAKNTGTYQMNLTAAAYPTAIHQWRQEPGRSCTAKGVHSLLDLPLNLPPCIQSMLALRGADTLHCCHMDLIHTDMTHFLLPNAILRDCLRSVA